MASLPDPRRREWSDIERTPRRTVADRCRPDGARRALAHAPATGDGYCTNAPQGRPFNDLDAGAPGIGDVRDDVAGRGTLASAARRA